MDETKLENLYESIYVTFSRNKYNWDEINQLSYEECLEKEEVLPLSDL